MGFSGVPEVVATNSPSYLPWLSAMLSPGRAVVSASRSSLLSETWVVAAGQVTLSPFGRVPSRPAVLAGLVVPARAGPGGNTVGVGEPTDSGLFPSEEVVRVSVPVDGSCLRAASEARPVTRMARRIPVTTPVRKRGDVTDPAPGRLIRQPPGAGRGSRSSRRPVRGDRVRQSQVGARKDPDVVVRMHDLTAAASAPQGRGADQRHDQSPQRGHGLQQLLEPQVPGAGVVPPAGLVAQRCDLPTRAMDVEGTLSSAGEHVVLHRGRPGPPHEGDSVRPRAPDGVALDLRAGIAQVDTGRGAVDDVPGDRRAPDPVHQRDAVPIRIGDVVAGDRDLPGRADDHDAQAATAHPVVLHAHVEPAGDRDAVVPVVARRAVGDRAVAVAGHRHPGHRRPLGQRAPGDAKAVARVVSGGALADGDVGRGAFERANPSPALRSDTVLVMTPLRTYRCSTSPAMELFLMVEPVIWTPLAPETNRPNALPSIVVSAMRVDT